MWLVSGLSSAAINVIKSKLKSITVIEVYDSAQM